MGLTKKYRQCVAGVLLLLYAFIAIPVQLWHHHDIFEQPGQDTGREQRIFTQANKAFNDSNCPVCQHPYSVYNDDVIIPAVPAPREFSSQNGYYTLALVYPPLFSFQNKGPPFLA